MEIRVKNYNEKEFLPKFLEGGAMEAPVEDPNAAPAAASAPEQGGDPMQQLAMACQQVLETQDCNLAMQVCQAIMQMIGGGAQGLMEPDTQPVFRKGGILVRRIPKN